MTIRIHNPGVALAAALATVALAGCDRETQANAERAGKDMSQKVETALDRTQEKLAEAGDKLQPKLAAAGERISEAGEKTVATVRDAVTPDGTATTATTTTSGDKRYVTTTVGTGPKTSVSGLPENTREVLSDAAITATVKANFVKEPGLSALKIDVDTKDGVVVLNGVADNASAKDRATQVAGAIRGVKDVKNHLTVKQG